MPKVFRLRICQVTGREWSAAAEQGWRDELFDFYGDNADEELLCIPQRDGGAYLPSTLIESRLKKDVPVLRWELETSFGSRPEYIRMKATDDWCEEHIKPQLGRLARDCYSFFGEDFGRSGDLTAIWPLQLAEKMVRRTRFIVELRNVPFRQQEQILFYLVDRLPRFIAGAMDASGNGQYLAEQAYHRYGSRVEQVKLSVDWYRDNMPRYKAAFEDGTIELPAHPDILMDHRAIKMEKGIAKVPDRYNPSASASSSVVRCSEYGRRPARTSFTSSLKGLSAPLCVEMILTCPPHMVNAIALSTAPADPRGTQLHRSPRGPAYRAGWMGARKERRPCAPI